LFKAEHLKPWPTWLSSFEHFKKEFLNWANAYLEEWSRKYEVSKPPVYIISDEKIDPWEIGAVYVTPDVRHSGILGPAILFREGYLEDLFEKAWAKNRLEDMWNYLLWTLAHEFGHHVRKVKLGVTTIVPLPLVKEAIRKWEISSSLIAHSLTGKTAARHNWDFLMVMGETRPRYFTRKRLKGRINVP
jgi:hypothetical protein